MPWRPGALGMARWWRMVRFFQLAVCPAVLHQEPDFIRLPWHLEVFLCCKSFSDERRLFEIHKTRIAAPCVIDGCKLLDAKAASL